MSTGVTRRRWKARKLREQGLSYREIARRMHCSISTAHSYVAAGAPELRPVPGLQDDHGKPVAGAEPGNTRSLTHGAYSEKRIEPRAAELVESATATVPWLAEPSFAPAVRAWARAEASVGLLVEYLDGVGMLEEDGEPRSAVNTLLKFERTAADARARLGLDPTSRARLEREMAGAAKGRFDLDELARAGREAMARRTGEAVSDEGA